MAVVLNDAGGGAVEADEAEAAHDAPGAEVGGEEFLVAKAVLEGDERGIGPEQRRDERGEGGVGGGLQGDEDDVARAHFLGGPIGIDLRQMEIAIFRADGQPVAADGIEVAAHEEMHVAPGVGQLRAIIAAHRAGADDAVAKVGSHGGRMKDEVA